MGGGKAVINMTSPWGLISPEIPVSVEESLGIHTSSELWYSPLTTQLDFTDFFQPTAHPSMLLQAWKEKEI